MPTVSVSREENRINFQAGDLQLNISWMPQLEADYGSNFHAAIVSVIGGQLRDTGFTEEEVAEALSQFTNLKE